MSYTIVTIKLIFFLHFTKLRVYKQIMLQINIIQRFKVFDVGKVVPGPFVGYTM